MVALAFLFLAATTISAQAPDEPYVVENYYRIKWGHQEEFIELYKKNHYPIVQKMMESGYITEVVAERSPLHAGIQPLGFSGQAGIQKPGSRFRRSGLEGSIRIPVS